MEDHLAPYKQSRGRWRIKQQYVGSSIFQRLLPYGNEVLVEWQQLVHLSQAVPIRKSAQQMAKQQSTIPDTITEVRTQTTSFLGKRNPSGYRRVRKKEKGTNKLINSKSVATEGKRSFCAVCSVELEPELTQKQMNN